MVEKFKKKTIQRNTEKIHYTMPFASPHKETHTRFGADVTRSLTLGGDNVADTYLTTLRSIEARGLDMSESNHNCHNRKAIKPHTHHTITTRTSRIHFYLSRDETHIRRSHPTTRALNWRLLCAHIVCNVAGNRTLSPHGGRSYARRH